MGFEVVESNQAGSVEIHSTEGIESNDAVTMVRVDDEQVEEIWEDHPGSTRVALRRCSWLKIIALLTLACVAAIVFIFAVAKEDEGYVCVEGEVNELKSSRVTLIFNGYSGDKANENEFRLAFKDAYNEISGGCSDVFERFMYDSKVLYSEPALEVTDGTMMQFDALISCHDCPDSEIFASVYPTRLQRRLSSRRSGIKGQTSRPRLLEESNEIGVAQGVTINAADVIQRVEEKLLLKGLITGVASAIVQGSINDDHQQIYLESKKDGSGKSGDGKGSFKGVECGDSGKGEGKGMTGKGEGKGGSSKTSSSMPSFSSVPSEMPSATPSEMPTTTLFPTQVGKGRMGKGSSKTSTSMPSLSNVPTEFPSNVPSCVPTGAPVEPTIPVPGSPTTFPSEVPSGMPSGMPSNMPSDLEPSGMPSNMPSDREPSSMPSNMPSSMPSLSEMPSFFPTSDPYRKCPSGPPPNKNFCIRGTGASAIDPSGGDGKCTEARDCCTCCCNPQNFCSLGNPTSGQCDGSM